MATAKYVRYTIQYVGELDMPEITPADEDGFTTAEEWLTHLSNEELLKGTITKMKVDVDFEDEA